MRRPRSVLLTLLLGAFARVWATEPAADFDGVWLGEIVAPNARTVLGLAFVPTERGPLVHLHLPGMFLDDVNFGSAVIRDGACSIEALNLSVSRHGDALTGTFGAARFPVELHRAAAFPPKPPTPELPAAPAPVWSQSLGAAAWASPVARDDVVYVGTIDGRFHAVSAGDGHPLWTWTGPYPLYGEALATADRLYFVDDHCDLVCLARADGAFRWRTPLHDEGFAARPPTNETFNHRCAAPVIDARNLLYVGSTDRGLYAIRALNGKMVWRHDAGSRIYAPVVLRGDEIVFAGFDGSVVAFNPRLLRESLRAKLGGPVVSAPVLAGDRIVVGSRDCLLYGLDGANGSVAWRDSYWFSWVESTPRLVDGMLYVGGSDYRRVSALDPATGKVHWTTDVRGLTWGSPVVTAASVFAGTTGQNLAGTVITHTGGIVALDRQTGAARWRYPWPAPVGADFTGCAGSLVLAAGNLVAAGVDGTLIAFPAN